MCEAHEMYPKKLFTVHQQVVTAASQCTLEYIFGKSVQVHHRGITLA